MAVDAAEAVNPKLVMAFVKSVKNVLTTMVGLNPVLGKPRLKTDLKVTHDVSGIVGFSGEVTGTVIVSFGEPSAMKLVEAFVGEALDARSEDFADALGELCNMIAGNAKKDFGLNANIGIPSVVVGPNHTVSRMSDVPCILIPCQCEVGDFAVEVNIKQVK